MLRTLRDISVKKAMLYPNRLLQKYEYSTKRSVLTSMPSVIQVEPTTRCNLKCEFCKSSVWNKGGNDMDLFSFKRLIEQFPYLIDLLLQGFGEPLMCKDFFNMVEYCKEHRISVSTVTNGTLLNNATIQKIIDSGIDFMAISVDGANPETFEHIRKGSNFFKVIENTRNLIHIRGNRKKPKVFFNFTGSQYNIKELPDVLRLAKESGVDALRAIEAYEFDYDEIANRMKEKELSKNNIETRKIINETMLEAKKISIPFFWDGRTGRNNGKSINGRGCSANLFRTCYINYNGNITTCTYANPDKDSLGNIFKQNFKEIWNNDAYISLRKAYFKNIFPSYCTACTFPPM
jgi:radical SAM protein with 4Fe4S-binding SPASM domain